MHDALYSGDVDDFGPLRIKNAVDTQHLNLKMFDLSVKTTARSVVASDVQRAERLGVASTPTFILCRPDGKPVRLDSIQQLSDYIK